MSAGAAAQDSASLGLSIPDATIRDCDIVSVDVLLDVRLSQRLVGGYQAFIAYPSSVLRPVRFEAAAIDATVFTSGVDSPITRCGSDDGFDSVVGVGATVYLDGPGDDNIPAAAEGLLLGRWIFAPIAPGAGDFQFHVSDCSDPFERDNRIFDTAGDAIETTTGGAVSISVVEAGIAPGSLTARVERRNRVSLTWTAPNGAASAFRVYRESAEIAELAADARNYTDLQPALIGVSTYRVSVVAGGIEQCPIEATVSFAGVFIRGDSDGDGVLSISDGVAILQHLFVVGAPRLDCLDAANTNNDASLNLADAVFVLRFLFVNGPVPDAPFPDPGVLGAGALNVLGCERGAPGI